MISLYKYILLVNMDYIGARVHAAIIFVLESWILDFSNNLVQVYSFLPIYFPLSKWVYTKCKLKQILKDYDHKHILLLLLVC
jgi:hypothetical protein